MNETNKIRITSPDSDYLELKETEYGTEITVTDNFFKEEITIRLNKDGIKQLTDFLNKIED